VDGFRIKALKDLGFPHGKATPARHQANAICERTVRKVVEGARTLLEHAGLPACFWPWAVRRWCFMDNTEVRTDGHSSWSKRFAGKHFEGPRLPFGCRVEYLPRPEEVKALPKFEPRAQVGILAQAQWYVKYWFGGCWVWRPPRAQFVGFEISPASDRLSPVGPL
jgi:hypothetical protein